MPGGPRKQCNAHGCSDDKRSVPRQLELYGARLGFAWDYASLSPGGTDELRVDTVSGGHERLDQVDSGSLTRIEIGWPAFDAGRVFWSRACIGDPSGCPGRQRLVESTYTGQIAEREAPAPDGLLSHERDRGVTTTLTDASGVRDCRGAPPTSSGTCVIASSRPAYRPCD